MVLQLLGLGMPSFIQTIIDDVLIKRDTSFLLPLALGFGLLVFFRSLTLAVRGYANLYLVGHLSYNIGTRVLGHLVRLPVQYFTKREIGDTLSRFGSLQPIYSFLTGRTIAIVLDGALSVLTLALMMVYSIALTGTVLVGVVLYLVAQTMQARTPRESTQERLISEGNLESSLIESIRNIREVRLANRELEAHATASSHLHDSLNARARFERQVVWYGVAQGPFPGFEQILVISIGAYLIVVDGLMTVGMLYAFLAFRLAFSNAAIATVDNFLDYKLVGVHLERVADILDVAIDSRLEEPASALSFPLRADLELQDVTFSYGDAEAAILSNVSLSVREGSFVALLGPSGAGKTTLLMVMMGLVDPEPGTVLLGGWGREAIGSRSFRERMAAVSDGDVLIA